MIMEDDDWDALASQRLQQNYAFVTAFSVILWDYLITFRQEVKYVWHCPSRVTKYLFLFCRYYAMGVEKDRARLGKLAESINTSDGKGDQSVNEEQSHPDFIPRQNQYRDSYPPRFPTEILPPPDREASEFLTQHFSSEFGGCTLDTVFSNFPYLHGARSYISNLRKNRSSMATTTITDSATDHSLRNSSDCASPRTASVRRSSWGSRAGSGPSLRAGCAAEPEATYAVEQTDIVSERNYSASNIEIGSLQSSSSVNSEELRQFDNARWNAGPFMVGGSWYSIT
ncbi:hypothetical protein D9619_008182 [Psilocybe cf. subviscida]|uniref:DUF6533 domain-containing protein n=1 Tax=Psilocybe cf. subviscida TaxID=2480587 RepID=A0A8H5AU17_9AGAR|nr:hypothetical protein D9619_008182 [Psilocybe cf. subviscida]